MYRCTRALQLSRGIQSVARQTPANIAPTLAVGTAHTCSVSTSSVHHQHTISTRSGLDVPKSNTWYQSRRYSSTEEQPHRVNYALFAGGIGAFLFIGSLIYSAYTLTKSIIRVGNAEKPKVPME